MAHHSPKQEPSESEEPVKRDSESSGPSSGTADLTESMKQDQYRLEHLRQIRQRSCPGCGDDNIF